MIIPDRVIDRAFANVKRDDSGCLISLYSVANHGYAQIGWSVNNKTKMVLVHRLVWQVYFGEIPRDMTIDHICKNRRCVDINHLRLLSNFENARRTFNSDFELGFCKNGHSNDELIRVTRRTKSGEKRNGLACRICRGDYQRRYRAKKLMEVS